MKKILSAFLICTLILSIFTFNVSAYTDVSGDGLTVATGLLKELDIMYGYEGNVFKPGDLITRAEFAVVVARMINVSEKNESGENYYVDVPDLHFALGAINNLTRLGIISGDPTGHFRPDDSVTAAEAYKMMLHTIGYGEILKYQGGWPSGCMNLANQSDIAIGVASDKPLTRAEVAILALNTLEAPYLEGVVFSGENTEYQVNKKENLLVRFRDVHKAEGVVTAVPSTTLVGEIDYTEGKIYIDGERYTYNAENLADLIGSVVEAYYYQAEEGDEKEIIFLVESQGNYKELFIKAKDIVSFNTTDYKLSYYEKNGDIKTVTIAKGVSVIRNNVAITNLTEETFKFENGSVKLKSSTGDSRYDVVIIEDYKNYVVGTVDTSKKIAYDYYNLTESINLDPHTVRLMNSNGDLITPNDLKAKDVLSVMRGSENYTEIYVSNGLTTGIVDLIDSAEELTYIDGVPYEIDSDLLLRSKITPRAGDSISYTLDYFGKIAYYEIVRELDFGYLAGTLMKKLDETLQFKIFCSDGTFKVFNCAKTIDIDEYSMDDMNLVAKYFKTSGGDNIPQLIRYKLNKQSEVTAIETVQPEGEEEGLQEHKEQKVRGWKIAGYFAQDIIINDDTLIFSVPEDPKDIDEESYSILSRDDLSEAVQYNVASYKTKSKVGYEEVVVILNNDTTSLALGDTYAMVESMGYALNNAGAKVEYISVFNGATKTQWYAKEGISFASKGIEIGDIVRPGLNTKGELINLELVYDCNSGSRPSFNTQTADFHAMNRVMFGYASDLVDSIFKLSYYPDGEDTYRYNIEKTVFVVFDPNERAGKQIYQGTIGDVVMYANNPAECSRFVLQSRYEQAKIVYVYK